MISIEEILARENVVLLDNPRIQEGVQRLRDPTTKAGEFTSIGYNLGRDTISEVIRREWVYSQKGGFGESFALLGILRAALFFMAGGIQRIDEIKDIPRSWGIVDAERQEGIDLTPYLERWQDFKMDVAYTAWKVPKTNQQTIITFDDPMLASASTLRKVIERVKEEREYQKLVSRSIFASAYGLETLSREFPEVMFYTCAIDDGGINNTGLNQDGYIVDREGNYACGDFGDRTANTVVSESDF